VCRSIRTTSSSSDQIAFESPVSASLTTPNGGGGLPLQQFETVQTALRSIVISMPFLCNIATSGLSNTEKCQLTGDMFQMQSGAHLGKISRFLAFANDSASELRNPNETSATCVCAVTLPPYSPKCARLQDLVTAPWTIACDISHRPDCLFCHLCIGAADQLCNHMERRLNQGCLLGSPACNVGDRPVHTQRENQQRVYTT